MGRTVEISKNWYRLRVPSAPLMGDVPYYNSSCRCCWSQFITWMDSHLLNLLAISFFFFIVIFHALLKSCCCFSNKSYNGPRGMLWGIHNFECKLKPHKWLIVVNCHIGSVISNCEKIIRKGSMIVMTDDIEDNNSTRSLNADLSC